MIKYYIIYELFVSRLNLKGSELMVYSLIYSAVAHMDGFISMTQIMRQTGLSITRVYEIVAKLEAQGLISRSAEGFRRKNKYKLYRVTVGADKKPQFKVDPSNDINSNIVKSEKKSEKNSSSFQSSNPTKMLLPNVNNL